MDNMMEAIKTLKEGCAEKPMCKGCSIEFLCDNFFNKDPVIWEIPKEEETKDEVEEETSIVVVQERLEKLIAFIDEITKWRGCGDCPVPDNISCNKKECQNTLLSWLQDHPIL